MNDYIGSIFKETSASGAGWSYMCLQTTEKADLKAVHKVITPKCPY